MSVDLRARKPATTGTVFQGRSARQLDLVVDAGSRFPGRRVLVAAIAVRSSDPATLHVPLSRQQVAASPDVSTRGLPGSSTQQDGVEPANLARAGESADVHLQAATAVMGYAVQTKDGEIGHVKDVLVDDQAWAIRYLLVDTENRWAGKKVLVSPAWLTHVTWGASKTLCCIATSLDNNIGSAAIPSIKHRQPAARGSPCSNASGELKAERW